MAQVQNFFLFKKILFFKKNELFLDIVEFFKYVDEPEIQLPESLEKAILSKFNLYFKV